MPPTLFIDLAGAERAVSMALALLNRSARKGQAGCAWVSLHECARDLAAPLKAGLTTSNGLLGGAYPLYGFYRANDGWIAIAALEPHFAERLLSELGLKKADRPGLNESFCNVKLLHGKSGPRSSICRWSRCDNLNERWRASFVLSGSLVTRKARRKKFRRTIKHSRQMVVSCPWKPCARYVF